MRSLLLAALALIVMAGQQVHAQSRRDLDAVARRLAAEDRFAECPAHPEVARSSCRRSQQRFIATYARARMGDVTAQREVASQLATGSGPLRADGKEACAWRSIVLANQSGRRNPADQQGLDATCGALPRTEREEAEERARLLGRAIQLDAEARAGRR
ncbi:hypothetical protein [Muricoccus radiodurans]|uniref:hypothetical protein n=1 Tax=Muricoccus radiodurans TaxID=2231721 RepID=UPI003CF16624